MLTSFNQVRLARPVNPGVKYIQRDYARVLYKILFACLRLLLTVYCGPKLETFIALLVKIALAFYRGMLGGHVE